MLNGEIENGQRLVKTDAYQLSIGEVVNMYRSGEFAINPDFQRLFRWEIGQKAKLIESLLLGIPIPSRRFTNGQPGGRVVLVAFECIAIGVARNIATVMARTNRTEWVRDRIRQLWESPEISGFFAAGLRGTIRIQRTIPFGERWFADE